MGSGHRNATHRIVPVSDGMWIHDQRHERRDGDMLRGGMVRDEGEDVIMIYEHDNTTQQHTNSTA